MKTKLFIICCLLFALLVVLAACGTPTATTPAGVMPSATDTATATATVTPTATATATSTIEPTPTHTHTPTPVLTTALEWECWNDGPGSECRADPSLSLKQMTFVSDDEAWAVGDDGYIAHWDGQHWMRVASPTDKPLNAIDFIAADDVWIAGEGGQLLHWDGNAWSVVREYHDAPPGGYFVIWNAIEFSGPDDGWLVGCTDSEGGFDALTMRWNGTEWQETQSAARTHFYCHTSIASLSAQDIWLVGGNGLGIVAHWNGESWQETETPCPDNCWLYAVSAVTPNNVWAAGLHAVREGHIGLALRWNGEEWLNAELPRTQQITSILMISENNGWTGGTDLFHWNGKHWEKAVDALKTEWGKVMDMEASPDEKLWVLTEHGAFLHLPNEK